MKQNYQFNVNDHLANLVKIFKALETKKSWTASDVGKLLKQFPQQDGRLYKKSELLAGYRQVAGTNGLAPFSLKIAKLFLTKPTRTMSGVTPVTILTKPFPCPGQCIFCPNDIRMPKSYLSSEPGAQRAERNWFDPYLQTFERLEALRVNGHDTSKVEIIILGGTWSFYPKNYQIWFVTRVFTALNQFGKEDEREAILNHYQKMQTELEKSNVFASTNDPDKNDAALKDQYLSGTALKQKYNHVISKLYVAPEKLAGLDQYQTANWEELGAQQKINETAATRSVGLVVETRPDNISKEEAINIRRLGATKVQIGFQSLNDEVLAKNHRGHDVAATKRAVGLLRQAGFKIHAHWMPNLYGSSPELDYQDYFKMFADPNFCPDELKIYPCSLLETAELMQYYQRGLWRPYTHEELLELLVKCFVATPAYCRLTRVVRDIGSGDIVTGNKSTNFRQIVQQVIDKRKLSVSEIRSREIRGISFDPRQINISQVEYQTSVSSEIFIQTTVEIEQNGDKEEKLLGFLRLSLPTCENFIEELKNSAMIREVHVYGQVEGVGIKNQDKAQHLGLGKRMIKLAQEIAMKHRFTKLAVISAIGTREYYRKLGFEDGEFYQLFKL